VEFKYHVKKLGVIKEAKIDVKPLTIVAGENATGKSFVTKSLYAALNALSESRNPIYDRIRYIAVDFSFHFAYLRKELKRGQLSKDEQEFVFRLEEIWKLMSPFVESSKRTSSEVLSDIESLSSGLRQIDVEKLEKLVNKVRTEWIAGPLIVCFRRLKDLINFIGETNGRPEDLIIKSVVDSMDIELKQNFQVASKTLIKFGAKKAELRLSNIGAFEISREKVIFEPCPRGLEKTVQIENVIYIESPVFTKLKKYIQKCDGHVPVAGSDYLKGYPQYVARLYSYLDLEYIGENQELKNILEEIEGIIKGHLNVTEDRRIEYISGKESVPVSLTAMGITNIGLIGLLIERNVLRKGSFLIIDEPEVHLHPEWQVKMAFLLYKLAENGVNVIVATHSLDIVKACESLDKEKKDDIIAFNYLPWDRDFDRLDTQERASYILANMAAPFSELYFKGL